MWNTIEEWLKILISTWVRIATIAVRTYITASAIKQVVKTFTKDYFSSLKMHNIFLPSGHKRSIGAISGLEHPSLYFPALIESKDFYTALWLMTYFHLTTGHNAAHLSLINRYFSGQMFTIFVSSIKIKIFTSKTCLLDPTSWTTSPPTVFQL